MTHTPDPKRANIGPADYNAWPCNRDELVDDLWALTIMYLSELKTWDKWIGEHAQLSGRNLQPWRPMLAVVAWLDSVGLNGLWQRMESLATSYQAERLNTETSDFTVLVSGNNEGSVHKLPNGRWRGQVSRDGHRLSKVFPTQRECLVWVRKNRNQIDDGMTYTSTQLTLGEYIQGWLTNAKSTKRLTTWVHYDQLYRLYISPNIGCIKLKDLRAEHIQRLYNQLLEKDIGVHTVRKIHALLHCTLKHAVKIGSINLNPASFVDPPRKPTQEVAIFTESQVSQMLVAAKGNRWEALYHLAIVTGMRESELLGLRWTDLDWVQHFLKVERQLQRPNGNGVEFVPPKTRYGRHSIALGENTIQVLRAHNERQQAKRVEAGETWMEYGLIFTTSNGTPIHPRNLLRDFKALLKQAGLPSIRFHDLRHTAASLILNHDVPVIVASRRLGHARASITMDVYGHLIPSMQAEAAEMIDRLVTPGEVVMDESTRNA